MEVFCRVIPCWSISKIRAESTSLKGSQTLEKSRDCEGSSSPAEGDPGEAGLKQRKKIQLPLTSFLHFASLITNILLFLAIIVIVVHWKAAEDPLPTHLGLPLASCPDDWVGYRSRCYYFSDVEADWESSKNHCLALNASLAVVDSQKEMEFLKRHKTFADHWIGLQRYSEAYPWKWTNGTAFNNWFEVRGGAECAYINKKGFASSSCNINERWICSRPMLGCHNSLCQTGTDM